MWEADLYGLCVLGLGGSLMGLFGILSRRWRNYAAVRAVPLVVAAGVTVVAAEYGRPGTWLAPLLLTALYGTLLLLRSAPFGRLAAAAWPQLRRPALPFALLLAASPALAVCWAHLAEPDIPQWEPPAGMKAAQTPLKLKGADGVKAFTDTGREIRVYAAAEELSGATLREGDAWATDGFRCDVIRTDGPGMAYNCHGFVFTGGRYWVQSADVQTILEDNGYQPVSQPRAGDLVVYRNDAGAVVHTGVVYSARGDGEVLVESKWGFGGRYLHAPEKQSYSQAYVFYHSARGGHVLRGLPAAPAARRPAPPQAARVAQ